MSTKKCYNDKKTFGGRLRLFRNSTGLNIVKFSSLLDISHSSLSQIENNKTTTSAQTISNLVQNTNINIYWLCTGEGKMIRRPEKDVDGDEKDDTYIYKEGEYDDDPEIAGLLSMTREILKSGSDYSYSLAANVRSFHHAIKTEKRLNGVESRLASLEAERKKPNQIRKEDPPIEKEEFIKKRAM